MKKRQIVAIILVVSILGLSSCAQELCPAYTKVDDKAKKEKKEGRF